MDKRTAQLIRQYVSSVANQTPGFVNAWLFGSFAKNKQKKDSDIDIAFILEDLEDSDKFDVQVKLMLLAVKFDSRIEPHPLSKMDMIAGHPLADEINKTGIEIKLAV
jgi:predicted nucleotidyltransferase